MSALFTLKQAFNWLAQPPRRNFTLTEAFSRYVQKRPLEEINANPLGYSRLGRAAERTSTGLALLAGASLIVTTPTLPVLAATAGIVTLFKGFGVIWAKTFDHMLRGDQGNPSLSSAVSTYRSAKIDHGNSKAQLAINRLKAPRAPQ